MSIESDIQSTESSIYAEEQKITELNSKIARLKAAKQSMSSLKNDIKNLRQGQQNIALLMHGWQGEQANKVRASLVNDFHSIYSTYYNCIDFLHDDINYRLMKAENEKYQSEGILGRLRSHLNSLWHTLQNALN